MRIVEANPPLMAQIVAAFPHVAGREVFFCWGDQIFNPQGGKITEATIEHERVHGDRQNLFVDDDGERGIAAWWMRYLRDPAFRLAEEIPAHQAEWRWHAERPNANRPIAGFRSYKHFHLHHIAARLAGPLYGSLMSLAEAKRVISDGRA